MQEPSFDRSFALAAQVMAMSDHYLEVACGFGARRVIGLSQLATDLRIRDMTLATVIAKLKCRDCVTGPDEIHLKATPAGRAPSAYGGDAVWCIPLLQRAGPKGSYLRRPRVEDAL